MVLFFSSAMAVAVAGDAVVGKTTLNYERVNVKANGQIRIPKKRDVSDSDCCFGSRWRKPRG